MKNMNKQLLTLNHEYILQIRFISNTVSTPEGNKIEWIGDKAKGKNIIDSVTLLMPEVDQYGNNGTKFQKVFISRSDIKELARRVEEIESAELIDYPEDDLPY